MGRGAAHVDPCSGPPGAAARRARARRRSARAVADRARRSATARAAEDTGRSRREEEERVEAVHRRAARDVHETQRATRSRLELSAERSASSGAMSARRSDRDHRQRGGDAAIDGLAYAAPRLSGPSFKRYVFMPPRTPPARPGSRARAPNRARGTQQGPPQEPRRQLRRTAWLLQKARHLRGQLGVGRREREGGVGHVDDRQLDLVFGPDAPLTRWPRCPRAYETPGFLFFSCRMLTQDRYTRMRAPSVARLTLTSDANPAAGSLRRVVVCSPSARRIGGCAAGRTICPLGTALARQVYSGGGEAEWCRRPDGARQGPETRYLRERRRARRAAVRRRRAERRLALSLQRRAQLAGRAVGGRRARSRRPIDPAVAG